MKLLEIKQKSVADLNIEYAGGGFYCFLRGLTSLEGAPSHVSGNFDCSGNELESLEGAPSKVDGHFICFGNELESLEGAPSHVSGVFDCSNNERLESLKGAPSHVGGTFVCSNNKRLESLEGAPSVVGGNFYCYNCKLTSLKGINRIVKQINGEFWCHANPIQDGLEHLIYILLIKGVKSVKTPNAKFNAVVNKYLKSNPSGKLSAVYDVTRLMT